MCGSVFGIKKEPTKWEQMFNPAESNAKWRTYALSKFATAMMAINLNKLPNVTACCVHPGAVRTSMTQNISPSTRKYLGVLKGMLISPEEAAENVVKCIETEYLPGQYQNAKKIGKLSKAVRDERYCLALSMLSEKLLKDYI